MLFFNFIFLFLLSLTHLSLFSMGNNDETTRKRNTSPTVSIRVEENRIPVIYYEYPGSKNVEIRYEQASSSISCSPEEISPLDEAQIKASSLTKKSKLDALNTQNPEVLSASTERFNVIAQQLTDIKALLVSALNQKSTISPESPSK